MLRVQRMIAGQSKTLARLGRTRTSLACSTAPRHQLKASIILSSRSAAVYSAKRFYNGITSIYMLDCKKPKQFFSLSGGIGGGMPPGGFRLNPNQQNQEEKPLEQFVSPSLDAYYRLC